jgi:hypothetical protein
VDALQLLPLEIWYKVSLSVRQSAWYRQDSLISLSLVCRALREATLPFLFSSCTFTIGRRRINSSHNGIGAQRNSEHQAFTWFSPSDDTETNILEYLRFIISPSRAVFVKKVRVCFQEDDARHYMCCILRPIRPISLPASEQRKPTYGIQGVPSRLIDKVILSLHYLSSLKELTFKNLPISTHHLQTLCHPAFACTLISLESCAAMDSQIGEIPMTYNTLRIRGDLVSGPMVKATITQSLTKLVISGQNTSIEHILKFGLRFDMLKTLAVNKEMLVLFMQYRQNFPNVLRLTVSHGPNSAVEGTGSCFHQIIPSTAFEKLEILECPLYLLTQFLGRQICELSLNDYPRIEDANFRELEKRVRLAMNQSKQLLSRLSTLNFKFRNVIDMGYLLEEFLAQCHGLKSCELHLASPRFSADIKPLSKLTVTYSDIESYRQFNHSIPSCF